LVAAGAAEVGVAVWLEGDAGDVVGLEAEDESTVGSVGWLGAAGDLGVPDVSVVLVGVAGVAAAPSGEGGVVGCADSFGVEMSGDEVVSSVGVAVATVSVGMSSANAMGARAMRPAVTRPTAAMRVRLCMGYFSLLDSRW
jgi:hypothetical protein